MVASRGLPRLPSVAHRWWLVGDGLRLPLPFSPVRGGDLGILPRLEDARGSSLGFEGGGGLLLRRRRSVGCWGGGSRDPSTPVMKI